MSEMGEKRLAAVSWNLSKIPVFSTVPSGQSPGQFPQSLPAAAFHWTRAVSEEIRRATAENGTAGQPTQAAFLSAMARAQVREDASADRSARLLGADAVAFGDQILFRGGRYTQNTERGRALLAHELTHLAHQSQTHRAYPQRSVAGDVLSVQFSKSMAEAMTDQELDQQMQLLRAHLQNEPSDQGASENLSVLEKVAYERQGTAQEAQPKTDSAPPASGGEEQHGKVWGALHSVGLVQTKHENAEILRKGWGSKSGVVVTNKDGDPINVEQLSDDEVIALDKELRGSRPGPPLPAAVTAAVVWPLACDATGKLHGQLPQSAAEAQQQISSMKKEDLEQSAEELEKSIATRKMEQQRLGEEGVHRARINEEESLLRAIKKKLSGS